MNAAGGGWRGDDGKQGQHPPGQRRAKRSRGKGRPQAGQHMGPTGSLGGSGRRRKARRGAGGRWGGMVLGKRLEHGLRMITPRTLRLL